MNQTDSIPDAYAVSPFEKEQDTIWTLLRMHLLKSAGCFQLFVSSQEQEDQKDDE